MGGAPGPFRSIVAARPTLAGLPARGPCSQAALLIGPERTVLDVCVARSGSSSAGIFRPSLGILFSTLFLSERMASRRLAGNVLLFSAMGKGARRRKQGEGGALPSQQEEIPSTAQQPEMPPPDAHATSRASVSHGATSQELGRASTIRP